MDIIKKDSLSSHDIREVCRIGCFICSLGFNASILIVYGSFYMLFYFRKTGIVIDRNHTGFEYPLGIKTPNCICLLQIKWVTTTTTSFKCIMLLTMHPTHLKGEKVNYFFFSLSKELNHFSYWLHTSITKKWSHTNFQHSNIIAQRLISFWSFLCISEYHL